MKPWRVRCALIHHLTLGLWIGSLGMAALTAAVAFPMMKQLNPILPNYANMPEFHWSIAAGHVANQVLTVAIWAQTAFAAVALLTFASSRPVFMSGSTRWLWISRGLLLLSAGMLVAFQSAVLAPRMDRHVRNYWAAAEAGRIDEARVSKASFDADHPTASRVLSTILVLVATGAVLGCIQGMTGSRPEHEARP